MSRWQREFDADDIDMGERIEDPLYPRQIDDIPEWDGDENVCPCCGQPKTEMADECKPCWRAGRFRDFDRHPSAEEN